MQKIEGFTCSEPIQFGEVSTPTLETYDLFHEYGLSQFDIQHVVKTTLGVIPEESPVRLVRFAEGVHYDWGCRVALSVLDEDGVAIGRLNGTPAIFASSLPAAEVRRVYDQYKQLYDNERNTLRLTNDIYPGAQQFLANKTRDFIKKLSEPVRILDLGSCAAGLAPYLPELGVSGSYVKVDTDSISLAVLSDFSNEALKFYGFYDSLDRIGKKALQVRTELRLGGRPNALVCSQVLHQLAGILSRLSLEEFIGYFKELIDPGGRLLIADFYYADSVSDEMVQKARELLCQRVEEHPELRSDEFWFGGRDDYLLPEEVQELLSEAGWGDFQVTSAPALEGTSHEFYVLEAVRKG